MSDDSAPKKHQNLRAPWQLGQSGNLNGRPKGSRNKFAQQYIDDFYEVWQQEGKAALIKAARNSPARYIAVAAALIPQHFKFEHEHTIAGLSLNELRVELQEAQTKLLDSGIDPELLGLERRALPPGTEE